MKRKTTLSNILSWLQ